MSLSPLFTDSERAALLRIWRAGGVLRVEPFKGGARLDIGNRRGEYRPAPFGLGIARSLRVKRGLGPGRIGGDGVVLHYIQPEVI